MVTQIIRHLRLDEKKPNTCMQTLKKDYLDEYRNTLSELPVFGRYFFLSLYCHLRGHSTRKIMKYTLTQYADVINVI